MVYNVTIKKEGYTDYLIVVAKDVVEATEKVAKNYPDHVIKEIRENICLEIL